MGNSRAGGLSVEPSVGLLQNRNSSGTVQVVGMDALLHVIHVGRPAKHTFVCLQTQHFQARSHCSVSVSRIATAPMVPRLTRTAK